MAEHGITTIDTGFQRPNFDAAYLIVENGRGAFVDCGTNHSVPAMLQALAGNGLSPADVDWLVLTHVHLDHAGGAGALMRELPNARLLVHPRGAPHMVDPSKLIAGATAVYGEAEMARSYGTILPVPAARVIEAPDGFEFELSGRPLRCIDTPGHARHHLCLWDARSRSWFTGDTFGLSYREFDTVNGAFALPTTTPVQFEPEALKASIGRLLDAGPEAMYVTHYGRVTGVERLAGLLADQIDAMVAAAREAAHAEDVHATLVSALEALYLQQVRAHGVTLPDDGIRAVLAMDIELNAQGLEVWLQRQSGQAAHS
ncbi:MBL fold metallo-hydrolase [Marilutibacter alkalisoli]|uniref:MBL fold metallo-hydrolase n=1 Tax=Marilutibacter alkalisoli TaxID=2591633 RepID=A0A514BWW6_9GAMM|nr:MBL fold metallo-hydrolase [Lysobacter alkalisoli]QDH71887.1 MBL fold metallo-hydrolase [Lysobacter alkalisoli]